MINILKYIAALIIAYLLGSINTSIIVGKIKSGEDIREHGSGNAGATNTLRTFGKAAAALVLIGDALKAVIAILIGKLIGEEMGVYAAGIGVAIGHNFPIFFGFKGGKGIVVSAVAILFADWRIGLIAIVLAIVIIAVTRYVSLGSVIGSLLIIVIGFLFRGIDVPYIIFSVVLGGLAIFRHRKNIVRLISGTENKLGSSKGEK